MSSMTEWIVQAEALLGRTLTDPEVEVAGRMHSAEKSVDEFLAVIQEFKREPIPEDHELPVSRFEAIGDGAQRIP